MIETKAVSNSLAAKIAAAAVEVGGKLKADKRNTQQNYDYISADKILSVGGQALAVQGVTIIPQVTGREILLAETQKGGQRFDAVLTMVMLVTDGQSEILAPWVGCGSDYAVPDKAAYKAMTSGHKYFVMKLLCIGEGNEDGEHEDAPPAQPKPATKRPAATGEEPPVVERKPEPMRQAPPPEPADNGGPVYTGLLAKIGKGKYPAAWARELATYKRVNEYELDGILRRLNLPGETTPDQVIARVDDYVMSKDQVIASDPNA